MISDYSPPVFELRDLLFAIVMGLPCGLVVFLIMQSEGWRFDLVLCFTSGILLASRVFTKIKRRMYLLGRTAGLDDNEKHKILKEHVEERENYFQMLHSLDLPLIGLKGSLGSLVALVFFSGYAMLCIGVSGYAIDAFGLLHTAAGDTIAALLATILLLWTLHTVTESTGVRYGFLWVPLDWPVVLAFWAIIANGVAVFFKGENIGGFLDGFDEGAWMLFGEIQSILSITWKSIGSLI